MKALLPLALALLAAPVTALAGRLRAKWAAPAGAAMAGLSFCAVIWCWSLGFLLLTTPVSSHAIARAAYLSGERPKPGTRDVARQTIPEKKEKRRINMN
jgi:hypothetical protein